jgi:hypothetical protein
MVTENIRPTYIYVGAGKDTEIFTANWADGATIHCIDSQPHSEFGICEYYENTHLVDKPINMFARPSFAISIVEQYNSKGYECSREDRIHIEKTGLLSSTYTRFGAGQTIIKFINIARNIIIWYHFNTCLPDDTAETIKVIGSYDGIICKGYDPHRSIIDLLNVTDRTLVFRGYAGTVFGIYAKTSREDIENNLFVRLSFDYQIRRKFKHFVFYNSYGNEQLFDTWEEFLENYNSVSIFAIV